MHQIGTTTGVVNDDGTSIQSVSPGVIDEAVQDLRLAPGSGAIDSGFVLNPDVLPERDITKQYLRHQQNAARTVNGIIDIGAFEFGSADQILTIALPEGRRGRLYRTGLQAGGGTENYIWSISGGNLPNGLWINSSTGEIFGKAGLKGIRNFTVTTRDAQDSANSVSKNMDLEIRLYAGQ